MNRQASRSSNRIDGALALCAIGALLLFVSLFLDWYRPGLTAWRVFEVLDLILAALCVLVLAAVFGRGGTALQLRERYLPYLGALAVVVVAMALINHPPPAAGRSPASGIWVALAASILILLASLMGRRVSVQIVLGSGSGRAAERRDQDVPLEETAWQTVGRPGALDEPPHDPATARDPTAPTEQMESVRPNELGAEEDPEEHR